MYIFYSILTNLCVLIGKHATNALILVTGVSGFTSTTLFGGLFHFFYILFITTFLYWLLEDSFWSFSLSLQVFLYILRTYRLHVKSIPWRHEKQVFCVCVCVCFLIHILRMSPFGILAFWVFLWRTSDSTSYLTQGPDFNSCPSLSHFGYNSKT